MALRDRAWAVVGVVGCLVLAFWLLPPEPPFGTSGGRDREESRAEQRADSLGWLARHYHERYRSAVWRDSLEALLLREDADPGSLLVRLPEQGSLADLAPRLVELARAESPPDPVGGRRILVAGVDPRLGDLRAERQGRDPRPPPSVPHLAYYAGEAPVPYCAVAVVEPTPEERQDLRLFVAAAEEGERSLLGPCRVLARYGPPGPAVAAWLERGGWRFSGAGASAEEGDGGPEEDAAPFAGSTRAFFVGLAPAVEACLAGSDEGCAAAVTGDDWLRGAPSGRTPGGDLPAIYQARRWGPSPPLFREHFGSWSSFRDHDLSLLADLEAAIGEEAFAGFWRSTEPLESAFRSAAGTSMGPWVGDWARARMAGRATGAAVGGAALLGSLLALALLVLGAAWAPRRWRVG